MYITGDIQLDREPCESRSKSLERVNFQSKERARILQEREREPKGVILSLVEMPKSESDPTGRTQHDPGAKCDAGKPRVGLVLADFDLALNAVAIVGTHGAEKYTDRGWLTVPNGIARYTDAMLRHWLAEQRGVQNPDWDDVTHAAQTAWNALARLQLILEAEKTKEGNE